MEFRKGYKYQLAKKFTMVLPFAPTENLVTQYITFTVDGRITILGGYAWDGASGPTFDTDNTMTPSLVHDALAQLMRLGFLPRSYRIKSNKLLKEMMLKRGMFPLRAKLWFDTLRFFGKGSVDWRNRKKIYEVA